MYQARICMADILGQPIARSRLPGAAPSHLHRSRNRVGRGHRGRGPANPGGGEVTVYQGSITKSTRGWIAQREGLVKLVAQDGVMVGGTSMGPERWRDPGPARPGGARPDHRGHAEGDDLRLPDLLPGHRLGALAA